MCNTGEAEDGSQALAAPNLLHSVPALRMHKSPLPKKERSRTEQEVSHLQDRHLSKASKPCAQYSATCTS